MKKKVKICNVKGKLTKIKHFELNPARYRITGLVFVVNLSKYCQLQNLPTDGK